MNNTQFRRLVLDTPTNSSSNGVTSGSPRQAAGTPSALGSRMRSSMPMTPRSVTGSFHNDFSRQLAERNAELNGVQPKKFRSSAAPKGSKLAAGYQDRTQLRTSTEGDEKATRVMALEEMVKLGQMDESTFQSLRDQIIGGDVKDVHLVRGLDYKLLKRVREGEDVLAEKPKAVEAAQPAPSGLEIEVDVEDEFEKLAERKIKPQEKEEKPKQGEMAPPPISAGKKRNRDDLMKELKAARAAATAEAKARQPALGARFKKLDGRREQSRVEIDEKGREVLIMVDMDGNIKRKVKKDQVAQASGKETGLLMPNEGALPLGMDVTPTVQAAPAQEEVLDIFEGVGTDFNPLGDVASGGDGTDDDDDSADEAITMTRIVTVKAATKPQSPTSLPSQTGPRNYFNDSSNANDFPHEVANPLADPAIRAALKKASTLSAASSTVPENEAETAKIARHKKLLESRDRDADDLDMGFGDSRFGDEEDGEDGRKVKLSVWGEKGKDDEGGGKGPREKRKRGAKKRKGDGKSAADVMKVLDGRKGEKR